MYGAVHYGRNSVCKNVLKWQHSSIGCELYFVVIFLCMGIMFYCT
jgi:hypothetical protein